MSPFNKRKRKDIVGKRQFSRRVAETARNLQADLERKQLELISAASGTLLENSDNDSVIINVNKPLHSDSLFDDSPVFLSNQSDSIGEPNLHSQLENCTTAKYQISLATLDDSSVFSSNETNDVENSNLSSQLKSWATVKHQISLAALSDLLKILSPFHPELPICARTLLKTPLHINTHLLENGEYCHIGLLNGLKNCLKQQKFNFQNNVLLKICFNIDGLPLFNSSNIQFWPILALVKNFKSQPFIVGLFCGNSKPKPLTSFMKHFVDELSLLLLEGFEFENKQFFIEVHSFVCDSPAKAYIKCIKTHGGYSSCDKCDNPGEYHGRVVFRNIVSQKRTDHSFRLQLDDDHHLGVSPLLRLKIDFIIKFPVDYMHNLCLGVVRKLLNEWLNGRLIVRLSAQGSNVISENLVALKSHLPVEFNRKPRTLKELAKWKATEFRTFLLYLGPLVLKNHIDIGIYEHFMLLHSAITILISDVHISKHLDNAREMLNTFVVHCERLYGVEFLVYNIHMLSHLCDDVANFGALDNFSAFPFESYLGQLKKLVRSPTRPLQQIYRRIHEINGVFDDTSGDEKISCHCEHNNGPLLLPQHYYEFKQYKKIHLGCFSLIVHSPSHVADCYCVINKKVVQIHNILKDSEDEIFILGKVFLEQSSFYVYPFESRHFGILEVQGQSDFQLFALKHLIAKCVILPYREKWIVFPLIHSIS